MVALSNRYYPQNIFNAYIVISVVISVAISVVISVAIASLMLKHIKNVLWITAITQCNHN